MQRRCCWPNVRPKALYRGGPTPPPERSRLPGCAPLFLQFPSSRGLPIPSVRRQRFQKYFSEKGSAVETPCQRVVEGTRHPYFLEDIFTVKGHGPSTRVPEMSSFKRLSVLRKVDFPHPEGPIRAVIWRCLMTMLISFRAWFAP